MEEDVDVKQLALADAPTHQPIGVGADLGLVTRGDRWSWATFSPDERYRYALWRAWEDYYTEDRWHRSSAAIFVAVCLNPSTADERAADPTVTRLIGHAKRHGCGALLLGNLFALRSTDPKELVRAGKRGEDPAGPHNWEILARLTRAAFPAIIVAAWGRVPSKKLERAAARARCGALGYHPMCFGMNVDASPKHPLYLRSDTPLVRWTP